MNDVRVTIDSNKKEFFDVLDYNIKETINLANVINTRWTTLARKAARKEGSTLDIGKRPSYVWRRGKLKKTNSYWDASLGAYRTKNRQNSQKSGGGDFRLQRYHITSIAKNKNKPLVASTVLSSTIANLFYREVYFPKGSTVWRKEGSSWKRWKKDDNRKQFVDFSIYETEAKNSMNYAIQEGLRVWKEKLGEGVKI